MTDAEPLLSIVQAARALGISRSSLLRLVDDGAPTIDLTPAGSRRRVLRIDRQELITWARERGR
jgi:hypothetical protein